jgi:hypothetical protein
MTGEPLAIAATLKSLGESIAAIWARGALLLWCLTTVCAVILVALGVGARLQIADAPEWLRAYGMELGLGSLTLLVFALFKTYAERPKPILSLLPDERQSFWSHARQPDGRILTTVVFRFQVTNFSKGSVMLSAVRLRRPWVRRRAILDAMLLIQQPNGSTGGFKNPIMPNSLTYGSGCITIAHPVGRPGKEMRVVVTLQDHAGRWHKLIFPHMKMVGGPVQAKS